MLLLSQGKALTPLLTEQQQTPQPELVCEFLTTNYLGSTVTFPGVLPTTVNQ